MRMISEWMPSCLSVYVPASIDPSSFSAKYGIACLSGKSSSLRFNNSRLDSLEPRTERTKSYKPILPKPDRKLIYSGTPKRRWRGTKSLNR